MRKLLASAFGALILGLWLIWTHPVGAWLVQVPSGGGGTPITISATCQGKGIGSTPSAAVDCTGVNFIAFNVADQNLNTPTDSSSNTYTKPSGCTNSLFGQCTYFKYSPSVSASMTFDMTGGSGVGSFQFAGFKNVTGSSLDGDSGQTEQNTSHTTCQMPASVTPSANGALLVAGFFANTDGGGQTYTIDSSFTVSNFSPFTGGTNYGGGLAYQIQTTATARQPTWTDSASVGQSACNMIVTK